jgi:hypothetical protein
MSLFLNKYVLIPVIKLFSRIKSAFSFIGHSRYCCCISNTITTITTTAANKVLQLLAGLVIEQRNMNQALLKFMTKADERINEQLKLIEQLRDKPMDEHSKNETESKPNVSLINKHHIKMIVFFKKIHHSGVARIF